MWEPPQCGEMRESISEAGRHPDSKNLHPKAKDRAESECEALRTTPRMLFARRDDQLPIVLSYTLLLII